MNTRTVSLAAFFFLLPFALAAGDVASFVDLGFSEDGNVYVFAQYGVEEKTLRSWADLNIVNVPRNDFVPAGRFKYVHNEPVGPDQDGSGALLKLVADNAAATEHYRLNFLIKGIPLFLSLENGHNGAGQTIEFRDFRHGFFYRVELVPSADYGGGGPRSSFYLNVSRSGVNGAVRGYRVGTPSVKRANITSYTIKKAIVNPANTCMIFIIEMTRGAPDAPDIRYMVETLKF